MTTAFLHRPPNVRKTELEVRILHCKAIGHQFNEQARPTIHSTYTSGIVVTLACASCTSQRHDTWSSVTGELLSRMYYYVEDYPLVGEGKNRAQLRIELMRKSRWLQKTQLVSV